MEKSQFPRVRKMTSSSSSLVQPTFQKLKGSSFTVINDKEKQLLPVMEPENVFA